MFRTKTVPGGVDGPTHLPRAALRGAIRSCAESLHHIANLAETAADGGRLDDAAQHLVDGVSELRADISLLRAALRAK
jgi:hypothetical protein